MTHRDPAPRRALEARALIATLAIAARARWSFDQVGPVLQPASARYLYVETAGLLLVPATASLARSIDVVGVAMREARSDALIVCADRSAAGPAKFSFAFGEWQRFENRWHAPMALYLAGGAVWLIPEPYHAGVRPDCFALVESRLRASAAPWPSENARRVGRRQADNWLARILDAG